MYEIMCIYIYYIIYDAVGRNEYYAQQGSNIPLCILGVSLGGPCLNAIHHLIYPFWNKILMVLILYDGINIMVIMINDMMD